MPPVPLSGLAGSAKPPGKDATAISAGLAATAPAPRSAAGKAGGKAGGGAGRLATATKAKSAGGDRKDGKDDDALDADSLKRRKMAHSIANKKKKLTRWQKFKRTFLKKAVDVVVNEHTEEILDRFMGARAAVGARRRLLAVVTGAALPAVGEDELSTLKGKYDMIDIE